MRKFELNLYRKDVQVKTRCIFSYSREWRDFISPICNASVNIYWRLNSDEDILEKGSKQKWDIYDLFQHENITYPSNFWWLLGYIHTQIEDSKTNQEIQELFNQLGQYLLQVEDWKPNRDFTPEDK